MELDHLMEALETPMAPSLEELLTAARWTRTQDDSAAFLSELRGALELLGLEVRDGDL